MKYLKIKIIMNYLLFVAFLIITAFAIISLYLSGDGFSIYNQYVLCAFSSTLLAVNFIIKALIGCEQLK